MTLDVASSLSKAYYIHGVVYGDYMDVRTYNDVKVTFKGSTSLKTRNKEGVKRGDSLGRSRNRIYRLIHGNACKHGNYKPVFTTYTFAESVSDYDEACYYFKAFIRKLRHFFGSKIQYLCIPEIQKQREAKYGVAVWHFHTVFFNLPYLDRIKHSELWGKGRTNIQIVKDLNDIGAYVSKYLSKDILNSKLYGKRVLHVSKGLFQPYDVFHKEGVDEVLANGMIPISSFEGVNYKQVKYKKL